MRTIILLIIIFNYDASVYGQGFYDNNSLLINRKNISKLNVSSVTATFDYPDSNFHPLSNFVFDYNFDNNGNINKRKHWFTDLKGDKYMIVTLVTDTGYFVPEIQHFTYKCFTQSPPVKFNQYKERTQQYISKVFNQFVLLPLTSNERGWVAGLEEGNFFADTILLDKEVHIPRFLLPYGDSVVVINDTIMTFDKFDEGMLNPTKYYLTENNSIRIDYMSNEDRNKVWRSYYINSSGLLYKETQNIFSTLYFYNSDNLHIRTETYQNDCRTTQTTFRYKYGSR